MGWKLLFLFLTFTHYVQSFDMFTNLRNHPHWKLVERTYNTWPNANIDAISDVGEPLILTPLIENQKIEEARRAARVDHKVLLPGIEITSYAGYLTVNKQYNGNLWFWYFPVADRSKRVNETPLIVWLQGGPGASSLLGLFDEIGPFSATNSTTLKENKYSWGRNHSLLFIDNPVGTGFSFADDAGYARNQTTIGENLYIAIQQFLTMFPELRPAPLFIAGESYAGKHIPSLGIQIHRHKGRDEAINLQPKPINPKIHNTGNFELAEGNSQEPQNNINKDLEHCSGCSGTIIKLQNGLAIGNGFIDPVTLLRLSYFAREVGLVDDEVADVMKAKEAEVTKKINQDKMTEAFLDLGDLQSTFESAAYLAQVYNYLSDSKAEESIGSFPQFVQRDEQRRALHVGNTAFSSLSYTVQYHLVSDYMNSAKPWLEELLNHYRVLVYSGHLDCVVPYHASVNTYRSLNYSGAEEYKTAERFPWFHNNNLAGYYKTGGKLTEVMVRGAGHMVPMDRPAQALGLASAFVRGLSLRHDTGGLAG